MSVWSPGQSKLPLHLISHSYVIFYFILNTCLLRISFLEAIGFVAKYRVNILLSSCSFTALLGSFQHQIKYTTFLPASFFKLFKIGSTKCLPLVHRESVHPILILWSQLYVRVFVVVRFQLHQISCRHLGPQWPLIVTVPTTCQSVLLMRVSELYFLRLVAGSTAGTTWLLHYNSWSFSIGAWDECNFLWNFAAKPSNVVGWYSNESQSRTLF